MKRIVEREPQKIEIEYPDDVARIIAACLAAGYQIDAQTAARAWRAHSADCYAGWLVVPSTSPGKIAKIILGYTEAPFAVIEDDER